VVAVPQTQRVVDVFLRYLQAEEITHVFGIVGGLLYPFSPRSKPARGLR